MTVTQQVKQTKTPTKIWIYIVVGATILVVTVGVILFLSKLFTFKKEPTKAIMEFVNQAKSEMVDAELDAKIAVAKLVEHETQTVKQLQAIKQIPDTQQRLDSLAKLMLK